MQDEWKDIDSYNPGLVNFRTFSTANDKQIYHFSELSSHGFVPYGVCFCAGTVAYPFVMYIDVMGNIAIWAQNTATWSIH